MEKTEEIKLIEKKEKQIKNILLEDNITFGMAKRLIQRIEVELLQEGDTYLRKTNLKNVPPYKTL